MKINKLTLIMALSKLYLWNMLWTFLLSLYFPISPTSAFLAVSYDSSILTLTALNRSLVSITSSLEAPVAVPSSFTSCTIRLTLCVNFPTRLVEPETNTVIIGCNSYNSLEFSDFSLLIWLSRFSFLHKDKNERLL